MNPPFRVLLDAFLRTTSEAHIPVVLCPSEEIQWIPPDLTLYQKDDIVISIGSIMSRVAVIVRIVFISTWNTGPRLCLSINWCEKTSRGAALHSTQKRTQVTYWHLLNEWGPIFTEIPPLKYLWWEHIQYDDNTFYKKHIIQRQIFSYPFVASAIISLDQWFLNVFCHAYLWKQQKNATWTLHKWL